LNIENRNVSRLYFTVYKLNIEIEIWVDDIIHIQIKNRNINVSRLYCTRYKLNIEIEIWADCILQYKLNIEIEMWSDYS
jgi:hypothetical protein